MNRARAKTAEPEADRRREILRAAIVVFAAKGYHGCRIADVAKQAGVAYGLVYHYFKNKEELLASVFDASFGRFAHAVDAMLAEEQPAAVTIERIVDFAFHAYLADPLSVRVLIFEIVRSPAFREASRVSALQHTMEATARLIAKGQKSGELRADVEPFIASSMLYGAIETALTTFVLGAVSAKSEAGVEQAKRDLLAVFLQGMAPRVPAQGSKTRALSRPA